MALDAIHIRSRSGTTEVNDLAASGWQRIGVSSELRAVYERRSSSPPPRPHRTDLGSSSLGSDYPDDDAEWQLYRTGESLATKALRMRHRFVKATHISDPSLPLPDVAPSADQHGLEQPSLGVLASSEPRTLQHATLSESSAPTLAELYSQLTQDLSTPYQSSPGPTAQAQTGSVSSTSIRGQKERGTEEAHHHAHRHRHRPETRHRSEWFISRALTKMRRAQHTHSSEANTSAFPVAEAGTDEIEKTPPNSSVKAKRHRCPRCGDTLPKDATAEDMARHRQSIGHRLGMNAPVSSASASEAPSPNASEAPSPAPRSRSPSPIDVSLLDASVQAVHRRSGKLPRRLSNAPRWKKIARDNVGHNLLSRMGWKEGMGLGVQEWKWQQLRCEKVKRQRSSAVRALLLRQASASQIVSNAGADTSRSAIQPSCSVDDIFAEEPEDSQTESEWMQLLLQQNLAAHTAEQSSLQAAFPFQYDAHNSEQQREAAQVWLSNLAGPDADWFQCLTVKEQESLEHALLSGQITLLDIQSALLGSAEAQLPGTTPNTEPQHQTAGVASEAMIDTTPSNALLCPVEVELRKGRSGIGLKRSLPDERRRSRDAEGSIEIRRPSSSATDLLDGDHKKLRPTSTGRPLRPASRSRSQSSAGRKQADPTRRQRELAYQKDKQDWLDLRASLS